MTTTITGMDKKHIVYKYTGSYDGEAQCKTLDVDPASRRVKNVFSLADVMDFDKDIIDTGAYTKTLKERGPEAKNLVWHLTDHSATLTKAAGKFSELYYDRTSKQLIGITEIRKTSWGNDLLEFYQAGDINQHSIGFSVEKRDVINADDYSKRYSIIRELKLYEGSSVLWGANEFTPNLSVGKGELKLTEEYAQKYLAEMERLSVSLRKGNFTDDTFELLEYRLLQLRTELKTIFDSFLSTTAPGSPEPVQPVNEDQKLLQGLQLLQLKLNHL